LFFKKLLAGANDGAAPVNSHIPSLIFVPTWINNTKISTMIDTGATSSLITISAINKLNCKHQIYQQPGEIVLGDSKTTINQYGWIYLTFRIDRLYYGIQAIVVDNLTTDLVLGMDFLKKFKVEINIVKQYLVLYHHQQKIYVKFEQPNAVRLAKEYTILPRCKCIVDCTISGSSEDNEMLLKVIDEKIQQAKRIRLCDGIVKIKNNSVELTIYNPTTTMVTLPKSMFLGVLDHSITDAYCSTLCSNATEQEYVIEQKRKDKNVVVSTIVESLTQHLHGNDQQYQEIMKLVQQHSELFNITQPRTIKTTIHHVINTGTHPPINAKPYFKTIEQRKNIQQEVDKMLKAGIIIPSNSPWSSPVVLLTKPDGSFRFIIDYRKLNAITKKDSYPQPTIEELLQRIGGHSWFTKLDLKSGYFQIPIQHEDKEKTAFITQDGLYQFEVLPMGLMNAPPTFQRLMNNIIGYKRWDYVLVYLDDILIFSNSFDDHVKHLQEIFTILSDHQFTLNPNKCSLAKQSIEFLSHTITKDCIVPCQERIQAILDIPQPTTLAQANKFIGKIGWYRKFIPNFAKIAAPIHKVTNKTKTTKKEFYWHIEQIEAADKLKKILTEEPLMLTYPHATATFILSTDASEYAIGGTLKQVINGKTHYNYFLSRLLTNTEKNYSTIEREALGIFWCMGKLQQYLGGRDVMIITDHKPLEQFHKRNKINSKRIEEWLIKHQDILPQILEVKYRKGCNHGDADGMSRPDVGNNQHVLNVMTRSMTKAAYQEPVNINKNKIKLATNESEMEPTPKIFNFTLERISQEQKVDPQLIHIRKDLLSGKMIDQNYVMENDVLYKLLQPSHSLTKFKLIYIPSSMRSEVMECYHDHPTAAHFGVNRTWLKLRRVCYWPSMKKFIGEYIRSCEECSKFNIRRTKSPGLLHPIEYPQGPLELVSMDFWGPTPQYSTNGNRYILVIMDYYTKYVVAMPLPNNTAITTANVFVEDFVFKYGVPRRLITDQGVHFANEVMKKVTDILGTNHIQTSAYHPQANGLVERFNGTFHPQLGKLYNAELNNWDDYLPAVIYAYNTGVQSSTGYSPFQLMFGRNPILPLDHTPTTFQFNRPNDYWNKLMQCMNIYREVARQQVRTQQQKAKQRFDKNRNDVTYNINDLVFWKVPGHRGKLDEQFSGPFIIVNKKHPSYTIQDTNSLSLKQVNISDLKPVFQRHI
jgi:predicted aspartyl protease